ncbi:1-(5-phosphoribosyl)-5-[(5-phosphoribosylamino) methylideneamino] imidazole-4-carboxamide isomerase [bacterium HR19]|nr:1-(5-phosphoribosyl)-5-[(5-phosphoribosylamino) methylideneamino] imidazole-4-carboxamide isomerase [bacterium HR19]
MFVIPSLDIRDGKVVRLFKGDISREILSLNISPVEVARLWIEKGARFLHIVDISAAFGRNQGQISIIKEILALGVRATVGGGVRSFDKVRELVSSGAWGVVISTLLFENKSEFQRIVREFGDKIMLALDFDENFFISIRGWKEKVKRTVFDVDDLIFMPVKGFIFTAVFRDGTGEGVPKEHFKKISEFFKDSGKILIASGGISSDEDILFLKSLGFWGAIVGRAFYEGKINVFEI